MLNASHHFTLNQGVMQIDSQKHIPGAHAAEAEAWVHASLTQSSSTEPLLSAAGRVKELQVGFETMD